MLLTAVILSFRPSATVKFAFILGSSKQGKARRASVDSNWVTANHLVSHNKNCVESINLQCNGKIECDLLPNAFFHVRGAVKPTQIVVESRLEAHGDLVSFTRAEH